MIKYIIGNVTEPQGDGLKIVAQIVNDLGGMGAGVALAIMKKWPVVRTEYKRWFAAGEGFALGDVQFVEVEDNIIVANMVAQHGYSTPKTPAIRYDALRACLEKVAVKAGLLEAAIHAPRFGAGLAGGRWEEIEKIVEETMIDVETTIYDFRG